MRQHSSRSPMPARLESRVGMPLSAEANSVAGTVIGITGREGGAYIDLNARGADQYFIFSDGFTVDGEGNATFAGDLGAISGTFDIVRGGRWENQEVSPTRGIRLDTSVTRPITWQYYIDMAATGSDLILRFPGLEITADGNATFDGELVGATGTFSGDVTSGATIAASIFTSTNAQFSGGISADSVFCDNAGAGVTLDGTGLTGLGTEVNVGSLGSVVAGSFFTSGFGTPIELSGARPTISGSRGGNAALASLLSAFNGSLWTDSTTA